MAMTAKRGKEEKPGMRVAILTGGGDCPGLNAAIRGVVMRGRVRGFGRDGNRVTSVQLTDSELPAKALVIASIYVESAMIFGFSLICWRRTGYCTSRPCGSIRARGC